MFMSCKFPIKTKQYTISFQPFVLFVHKSINDLYDSYKYPEQKQYMYEQRVTSRFNNVILSLFARGDIVMKYKSL